MLAVQGHAQDLSSLVPVALIIIADAVVFWRMMIKVAIIVLILLMVLGFFGLLQSLH